jgi:thiamine transporter ThiT
MSKSNFTVKWITKTAILLALLIVIQLFRMPQLITGVIVNFILLLAFVQVDVFSGIIIGLISPVVAFLLGILAAPLAPMIPFIMLGNAVYVAIFAMIRTRKPNWWKASIGVIMGASVKFTLLTLAVRYLVNAPPKIAQAMSIPQLYTALTGGVVIILLEFKWLIDQKRPIQ